MVVEAGIIRNFKERSRMSRSIGVDSYNGREEITNNDS
jgi:hypothetical protein